MASSVAPRRTVKRATTREDAFLAAMLAGAGISDACRAAGISRSTGCRIRKTPEFQARFRDARSELLTATIAKLHTHSVDFVKVLHTMATSEAAKGSDRVLAARHGLDLLLRGVETLDFSERLSKLEQATDSSVNR